MRHSLLAAALFLVLPLSSLHANVETILTSSAWKTTSPQPPAGWNTAVNFDDSSWVSAFQGTSNHIWDQSTKSADSPSQAWFRLVFFLSAPVTAASGTFTFDDNGEEYINGTQIIDDTGGGASSFTLTLDPSLFVVGANLIAIHGINTIAPDNSVSANMTLTSATPEPASLSLLAAGSLLLFRRRK